MMASSLPVTPHQERDRSPHLMTDEELRREYVELRKMNASLTEEYHCLQGEINAICEESVRFQQSTEIEEEKVANQLLRRLQSEESQKRRFHSLIRREESARQEIMNQITQIRTEKTDLEGQVGQQESLMLQLQKKLMDVVARKNDVERDLLQERRKYLDVISTQLNRLLMEGSSPEKNEGKASEFGANTDAKEEKPTETSLPGATNETSSNTATPPVFEGAAAETDVAINRLEKQLNKLLREHAAAAQASARNEVLCAELTKKLETIQQFAFLDRARASKLKEELMGTRSRLAELETQARQRGTSVISDDSSSIPTPTLSCFKTLSLRDRTREVLSSHQREPSSSLQPSCDASQTGGEESRFGL